MRVAVVEDHDLFAEALDVALSIHGHDVRRVLPRDVAGTTQALTAAVLRERPQVVLLDLDLGPSIDGVHLVEPLTAAGRAVVILSGTAEEARLGECLQYGARAVVPKADPLNNVLAAIRHIGRGEPAIDRHDRERLLAHHREDHRQQEGARARLETLSLREREVLGDLMRGRSVVQIARAGHVSEATVRTQVRAIRSKLGVSSQLAAVALATRAGWRTAQPGSPRHRFG